MSNSKPLGSDPIDKFIEYEGTSIAEELILGDFGGYKTTDGKEFEVGEGAREAAREHQRFLNKNR